MDMLDPGLDPAASATVAAAAASHEKGPEAEEGVELQEAGEGPGPEEQTAVAIASVQQTAFADHNIQYQFRTENNGGQTGTQRTIAPRTHPYSPKMDGTRTPRDERRRAQHNEVERRRRDKINNWIVQLSKIIPDCNTDNSKTGASKGGILSKACDYIRELRQTSQRLQDTFKEAERLQVDNDLLRQQIEELKNENSLLRAQLQQHGLDIVGETPRQ
uniref:Upstream stimulatory factor 2 n=1 Tax=Ornithorhynchus anatinus TaxID=9258 RepID=A0A6I8PQE6_ORNAN